ncbi:hypothetical protein JCM11491_006900 [Sporobolomyces phaffii]
MSSAGLDTQEMPPPPVASASAKGKEKRNELAASKRKRLACELGNYQCPGEPTRKKRAKKGELRPDDAMLELEAKFKAFDIGGAITFQLIERGFKHAPPNFPGLPTGFYKQYVRTCAGTSKEREIAAEVLCAAFVAGTSAFTDHAKIIGSVSPDMPTVTPSGVRYDYSSLAPFGLARSSAVLALSFQSRQIFEDSTMRHRPTPEAIISLIAMDWMANLTREVAEAGTGKRGNTRGETRIDTEYAEVLCRSYRTLMMGRRSEIKQEDLELLLGPVNAYLLSLDARNAATTGSKTTFATLLEPIWTQIDLSQSNLALILSSLTSLISACDSLQMQLKYDLDSIVHTQQLHLAQLDLLVYQKIVQAFVPAPGSSAPPSPALLDNYAKSRSRVQDVFRFVVDVAQQAIETSSWSKALQVVEVLAVSSAWTNLGKVEGESTSNELLFELGVTREMGQILEQCLALAAWSSPGAARQRQGLLAALVSAFGPLPPVDLPPPPTTLPPPPKPPSVPPTSRTAVPAATFNPAALRDEDFQLDLSFLDDFAREHGIPIEDEPDASHGPRDPSPSVTELFSTSAHPAPPPLPASHDWTDYPVSDGSLTTAPDQSSIARSNPLPDDVAFAEWPLDDLLSFSHDA